MCILISLIDLVFPIKCDFELFKCKMMLKKTQFGSRAVFSVQPTHIYTEY